jgi:hypothetical protein
MTDRVAHIVDTCVFVACGRTDNPKFRRLATETKRRDATFRIPPRVYEELGGNPETDVYGSGSLPIDHAIQAGWATVMDPPDYTNSTVSRVMDDARRFISTTTDRSEDSVEKTDTAVVGLAVQLLREGLAERVVIYTGDKPAGNAAERVIPRYGFDADQIEWIDGNEFVDSLQGEL